MITIKELQDRKEILSTTLCSSEECLASLKERVKIIKKEIDNAKGALIELDNLIDGVSNASA